MVKLWKVRVNNWGWNESRTYYAESREGAEAIAEEYPAHDSVQYAGMYTDESADAKLEWTRLCRMREEDRYSA